MKRDLERDLRLAAHALEREVPESMRASLHERMAREATHSEYAPAEHEPARPLRALRLAAASIVAAGLLGWAWHAYSTRGGSSGPAPESVANTTRGTASAAMMALPSQGLALAANAGAPLTREWESLKRDSKVLVHGLWRKLPPFALHD